MADDRRESPTESRDRDDKGRFVEGNANAWTSETAPRNGGRPPGPSITARRARTLDEPVTDWPHFVKLARDMRVPEDRIATMTVADLMAVSDLSHAISGQAAIIRDVIDRLEGPIERRGRVEISSHAQSVQEYIDRMLSATQADLSEDGDGDDGGDDPDPAADVDDA